MVAVYPFLGRYDCGLFRLFGPGLGNCLFIWAKALVFAQKHNLPLVAPTWPNISIGAIIRKQADKRFYADLFGSKLGMIVGLKRLVLLYMAKKVTAADYETTGATLHNRLVIITGGSDYFNGIEQHHAVIFKNLISMTKKKHQVDKPKITGGCIGVHVRLGDFASTDTSQLSQGTINARLPFEWYEQCIRAVRQKAGSDIPVRIFSDGRDEELMPLLALPNVSRSPVGSAITDLLTMSQASVLIASGSTFSMWASFLGRMPVIWYPGQCRQKLYYDNPSQEIEFSGTSDLPDSFCKQSVFKGNVQCAV